jgi:hypothetical protein
MTTFMGKDQFVWWQGVVEDVDDPLMLGRCRVRCLGFHTEKKNDIGTEDLPWAIPIQPITSAAMSGMGFSPTGLVPGSWVVGFFRDGLECQEPIIMGSIGGIPQKERDESKGFNDPRKTELLEKDPRSIKERGGMTKQTFHTDGTGLEYEDQDKGKAYPKDDSIKEPDTNRLARNEKINDTIVKLKKDNQDKNVPTAAFTGSNARAGHSSRLSSSKSQKDKWTEPNTPYNAQYPHNHVRESESGHTIEIDDTPGAERLHTYHRSGTFEEKHPAGDKVEKIVRDNYTIILRDNNVHVDGMTNVTIDKGCKIFINGDAESGNHLDIHVGNGSNLNVDVNKGNLNMKVGQGDCNLQLASGNLNTHVNGNHEHYVSGNYNLRVNGTIWAKSGGVSYYTGSNVRLNEPGK